MQHVGMMKTAATLAILAATAGSAFAIDGTVDGELVALGKKTGVGARALGMGEAFTAVADDYSALYYNPAGMTQLSKSELGLNLRYGMAENSSSFQGGTPGTRTLESTKLNALTMVLTDRHRWALGLGYYTPVSFDDPLQYFARGSNYSYDASGQLDHYRLALAYLIAPNVSLGFAVGAIAGQEQLEIQDVSTVRYLEEYTGYNLEPSFLIHLSEGFSIGGSAVVVEQLRLTDTYQEKGSDPIETIYDIQHPFQTRLGLAFQSGLTTVSADWHGDFWSGYTYNQAGAAFASHDVRYPNKHTFSLGLEQYVTCRGPVLRAGYSWTAQDEQMPQPGDQNPYRLSAGIGFTPARNLTMDFAYQYAGSRVFQNSVPNGPADLSISGSDHQVMGSLRLRW